MYRQHHKEYCSLDTAASLSQAPVAAVGVVDTWVEAALAAAVAYRRAASVELGRVYAAVEAGIAVAGAPIAVAPGASTGLERVQSGFRATAGVPGHRRYSAHGFPGSPDELLRHLPSTSVARE